MVTKQEKEAPQAAGYTKDQIVQSSRFAQHRDVVSAFLEDGKTYTLQQVEDVINDFLKKEVK